MFPVLRMIGVSALEAMNTLIFPTIGFWFRLTTLCLFTTLLTISRVDAQLTDLPVPRSFVYAVEKTLYSQYLMEERQVYIHLPSGYENSNDTYPVIYVTDGDWHIFHLSGILDFLAGNELIPPCILVAIPHQDRNKDLLPAATLTGDASGNAENFIAFVEQELIPAIDQEYKTQKFKVLAGHSYGGLFTTWVLVSGNTNIFNGYIAADPSLWWDGRRLINGVYTLASQTSGDQRSYYFDQSVIASMGGTLLAERLNTLESSNLRWEFIRMEDESHGSIVHKSYYNGLEFVFENWPHQKVTLSPSGGMFMSGDSIAVSMSHPRQSEGVIRYTTDGSVPTSASPVYSDVLSVSTDTVIQASLFLENDQVSSPVSGHYTKGELFPKTTPDHALSAGLQYQYYAGWWLGLPDFNSIQAIDIGTKVNVGLYQWRNINGFALRFSGYFLAETNGIYAFSLVSDDGSRLLLDGVELITNDGLHAQQEVRGYVWLEDGYHTLEVQYFEQSGDEVLNLLYQKPGSNFMASIPNRLFFH